MATNRSKSAPKRETRTPVTFETAVHLCPHQGVADNVAQAFGLIVPEYEAIRAQHSIAVKRMAEAFEGSLNDKATAMHFQRIVGALVSSAVGAGRFYSEKVTQARDATARAADGGDDEHGAPIGLESRAQRTREFAADMAMQAFALLAAAHGAIDAYRDLTGEDWKAYEAAADATVEKKAAASQMGAFGGLTPPRGGGPKGLRPPSLPAPYDAQPAGLTVSFNPLKANGQLRPFFLRDATD